MVGFFFGGPGCLMLAGHVGQPAALGALAAVVAASLLLAASWRERLPRPMRAGRAPAWPAARRPAPGAAGAALLSAMTAVAGYGLLYLVDAGWAVDGPRRHGRRRGHGADRLRRRRLADRSAGRAGDAGDGLSASGLAALAWTAQAQGWIAAGPGPAYAAQALGSFEGAASVALMTLAMRFARRGGQAGTDMTAVKARATWARS